MRVECELGWGVCVRVDAKTYIIVYKITTFTSNICRYSVIIYNNNSAYSRGQAANRWCSDSSPRARICLSCGDCLCPCLKCRCHKQRRQPTGRQPTPKKETARKTGPTPVFYSILFCSSSQWSNRFVFSAYAYVGRCTVMFIICGCNLIVTGYF